MKKEFSNQEYAEKVKKLTLNSAHFQTAGMRLYLEERYVFWES